jgi:pectate lyase
MQKKPIVEMQKVHYPRDKSHDNKPFSSARIARLKALSLVSSALIFVSMVANAQAAIPASGYVFSGRSGNVPGASSRVNIAKNIDKSAASAFKASGSTSNTEMTGYAAVGGEGYDTTTGGQGGEVTTVTTLDELKSFAAACENNTNPKIVYIQGKIESSSTTAITIKHGANLSIYGLGSGAELVNLGLNIRNYKNVIIRNLKIREVFYPNDALTIDACSHVWVDHNEFHSKMGEGITVDTYDGLLDIKNGSRYVTVSWNYLHDHMKCSLIGHSDKVSQQETDSQIRVTYHHNYFDNTDARNPSLRFGVAHLFNNYFKDISGYGLAARDGAHAKAENNVYENVKLPLTTDKFPVSGLPSGYICESSNIFTNSGANVISQAGCDFWDSGILPYTYTPDDTATVPDTVSTGVGTGKITVP